MHLAALAIQHVIHTPPHFINFCPIVVWRWTSLSTTTTTNVLHEKCSLTVFSDLNRNISKHCWRESSGWFSHRNACAQPPKELVDVSPQICGEAALQLATYKYECLLLTPPLQLSHIDIHYDVHVGNGGTTDETPAIFHMYTSPDQLFECECFVGHLSQVLLVARVILSFGSSSSIGCLSDGVSNINYLDLITFF
jgi:hypothetical protein